MLTRARVAFFALAFAIPPASAACTDTANVSDAYMALDPDGNRQRTLFYTDTVSIYCVANFASSRTDVTLNLKLHQLTRWDFTKNQFVSFDAYPTETEIAPGATATAPQSLELLHLDATGTQNDSFPYVAGDYQCEISVDGKLQKTLPFSIAFPPCPDTQITGNSTCLGFYKLGDRCPEFGAGSTQPASCTCQVPCTSDLTNNADGITSYAPVGASCPTANGGGETVTGDTNLTGGDWSCDPLQ